MLHTPKKRCVLTLFAVIATLVNSGATLGYVCLAAETCESPQAEMGCCGTDACCCCTGDETTEECGCQSDPAPSVPVQETPIMVSYGDQNLVLLSLSELVLPTPVKCHGTRHMAGVRPVVSSGLYVRNCVCQT